MDRPDLIFFGKQHVMRLFFRHLIWIKLEPHGHCSLTHFLATRDALAPHVVEKLRGLRDTSQIKSAFTELCSPYGAIVRIEVIPDGWDAFICYVDLGSVGANAAMCRELEGFPVGTSVGFYIPLQGE